MFRAEGNSRRKKKGRIPAYTNLRCPMVGNQACWCRMLCKPIGNLGVCGRLAPHSMKDRTQRAIALHLASQNS